MAFCWSESRVAEMVLADWKTLDICSFPANHWYSDHHEQFLISYIFLYWEWLNQCMTISSKAIGDNSDEDDREFPCVAYSSPTILSQYILHIWNKSSWKKSQISQVLKKVKSQSSRANWLLATGHHLPAVQCTQVCISPTCHPGAVAQLCSSFSYNIFIFPVVFNSFYYSAATQW